MRIVAAALASILAAAQASAQAVPNGATATTASTGADGRIAVGVAPANASGISHNGFTEFSVPKAGLDLDNRGVFASTIVNEVTGAKRSELNGPLAVLGTRAHVVLANPNGITVDGGSFVNTGGVLLGAGAVRYAISPSTGLSNAVISSGTGDVTVSGAGLSGSFPSLQILAGRIRIDGPVLNSNVAPGAEVALHAGPVELELDSSVSPLTTTGRWAARRDISSTSSELLVDVTPRGSISASRVTVQVNAKGAGVSFAGAGTASIGDFSISTSGKVTLSGANIRAEKAVRIAADAVSILNSPEAASSVASLSKSVTILAAAGNVEIFGQVTGVLRDETDPESRGGVTIRAAGDIRLKSEAADRLAIVFASRDDLDLRAAGDLDNDTGRLLSNARTVVEVGGTLRNLTGTTGGSPDLVIESTRRPARGLPGWFGVKRKTMRVTLDYGSQRIPGQLGYLVGNSVDIVAGRVENAGEIDALDGSLSVRAKTIVNRSIPVGIYRLDRVCGLTCWSRGFSDMRTVGGVFNVAGTAFLSAEVSVENRGDVTAYGNLVIRAPAVSAQAHFLPRVVNRTAGFYSGFTGGKAIEIVAPEGGRFLAPLGTLSITSTSPVLADGGVLYGKAETSSAAGVNRLRSSDNEFRGGYAYPGTLRHLVP